MKYEVTQTRGTYAFASSNIISETILRFASYRVFPIGGGVYSETLTGNMYVA